MHAILTRELQGQTDVVAVLRGPASRMGRSHTCEVVIGDNSVSRLHATVERRGSSYVLIDHDSRNGTWVNGIAVMRHSLRDGDRVKLGDIELAFHLVDSEPAEAERPDADTGDGADGAGPATVATAFVPDAAAATPSSERRAVGAWHFIRSFSQQPRTGVAAVLKSIAEDVAGMRDVRRVVLYVSAGVLDARERWIKAGEAAFRPGVCFPDERIVEVARSGTADPGSTRPRSAGDRGQGERLELLSTPIFVRGKPAASLTVEAHAALGADATEGVLAAGDAIGMGLDLVQPGETPGQDAPAGAAVQIVGTSRALQQSMRLARKAAASDATVLICGESGTGKELFARLVYEESPRRSRPFIAVHCSAIEETLLGSTLFGHERGAFTGAVGMKRGLFEEANGGTIFLDEIGELSAQMQVKLLRVLQEGEFMRLGGTQTIRVDVRVVAATNRDLAKAVRDGVFREDLYYRLNVLRIDLPALRQRPDDIPHLVGHFMAALGRTVATEVRQITPEALDRLQRYEWPGNVRELRNVLERALVMSEGPELTPDDLPAEVASAREGGPARSAAQDATALSAIELQHVRKVLDDCGGNRKLAALRLGISRSTLYEKLRTIERDTRPRAGG